MLSELLAPLVAARMQGFDPEQFRATLLREVRQAMRAEAAGSSPSADGSTDWMDHHA